MHHNKHIFTCIAQGNPPVLVVRVTIVKFRQHKVIGKYRAGLAEGHLVVFYVAGILTRIPLKM